LYCQINIVFHAESNMGSVCRYRRTCLSVGTYSSLEGCRYVMENSGMSIKFEKFIDRK